ncbi:HNH endonuclease [Pantoea phage vB_PagM_SSEM1]|uniref:Putative HNH endonuclease n=1 Tax=Pantoea phage vB_PagM_SSEM1 TaxID=2721760 RepID=A0A6H0D8E8_9CAUD|nr:HNH endonuclease [Pantoea phage vB_PagM_SSEM1]QIS79318.1 putative HNH endonuclease [Pantoea phage vB_PagM_SSEM1]
MYGYCGTEAKFTAWLQSALRGVWAKHPSKLTLLQKKRVALKVGTSKKPIFHVQCEHCHKLFKLKEIEVNHKNKCGGLSDLTKLNEFVHNLLLVQPEDLELLCHDCHGIVTYMERYGATKRDAIIEKKVIAFSKLSDKEQMVKCKQAGFNPIPKTKIGRKNMVREYLKKVIPQ